MGFTASDIQENDSLLASLYSKAAGEEEESEEEEEEETPAPKTAAKLSPKPRVASKGAKALGSVSMSRTAGSEISDLANLWDSAPDVSSVFSNKV